MKRLKLIPIKSNHLHFNLDTDRDGFPDYKDCRPFNPRMHSIEPSETTKKRLQKIPLHITDEPIVQSSDDRYAVSIPESYHILSKQAKQMAPKARTQILSTIKKYPGVVGELERRKPKNVFFTSVPTKTKQEAVGEYFPYEDTFYVKPVSPEILKGKDSEEEKIRRQRRGIAEVIFHEGFHEGQAEEETPSVFSKTYAKHKLSKRRFEKQATKYQYQKIREYDDKGEEPTGKEISKILDVD